MRANIPNPASERTLLLLCLGVYTHRVCVSARALLMRLLRECGEETCPGISSDEQHTLLKGVGKGPRTFS